MERINSKDVQSMMEAYASIYNNQEQEVISEETQELEENRNQRGAAARANRQAAAAAAAQGNSGGPTSPSGGALSMRDRIFARRSASPAAQANTNRVGQNIKVGSPTGPAQNDQLKKPTGTAPAAPTSMANKAPTQSPTSNLKPGSPSTVVSPKSGEETKFERRLPSMAELRAAQAARKAATAGGASDREAGYQAVKAGVGVSKGTVKDPKIAADAARKAELERIRSRAASQTKAGVRPTVASTADPKTPPSAAAKPAPSAAAAKPAPKPAGGKEDIFTSTPPGGKAYGNAAKPAPKLKKPLPKPGTPAAKNAPDREEVLFHYDPFEAIKGYLMSEEGYSEDEALKAMTILTDEERTEILEGSCGSKKKKKGGYGK